jgi:hypothetical protein
MKSKGKYLPLRSLQGLKVCPKQEQIEPIDASGPAWGYLPLKILSSKN